MTRPRLTRIGIFFGVLCMMAVHCANPTLPKISIVSPEQNAVYFGDSGPFAVDVEVRVPLPGCGAKTYPIEPTSFTATLQGLLDGEPAGDPIDVTPSFGEGVLDPETGAYVWTGTVNVSSFGDYELYFTIGNTRGQGANDVFFRVEQTVATFPGGTYTMTVSSLGQNPASCLVPNILLGTITNIIKTAWFMQFLPSGADILAWEPPNAYPLTLELPSPLSWVDVVLSLDGFNNDILMDGPPDYTIDFTPFAQKYGLPLACVITASADGMFNDIDPLDPDGLLTVQILDVQASPGGTCNLSPPAGDCALIVGIDAD